MPDKKSRDRFPESADSGANQGRTSLPSRRSILRGGAIAGALGLGLALTGGTGAAALSTGSGRHVVSAPGTAATGAGDNGSDAVVIYLADPRSGEFEIFTGTTRTHRVDHALAARVASLAPSGR